MSVAFVLISVIVKLVISLPVSAELLIYPKGGHGFIFGLPVDDWMGPIYKWMQKFNWTK